MQFCSYFNTCNFVRLPEEAREAGELLYTVGHAEKNTECNHRMQRPNTITECNHRIQPPPNATTEYNYRMQPPNAMTKCNYEIQPPNTTTECNHRMQPPNATTECNHRMPEAKVREVLDDVLVPAQWVNNKNNSIH